MSPRAIILSAVGFFALIVLAITGYFLSIEVEKIHQENTTALADFGSKVVPLTSREGDDGITFGVEGGNIQLPPSLQQKKLSATEKVILSLSRDKDELLVEIAELREKVDSQQQRLQELKAYKAENERFAPAQLLEERKRAQVMLKEYFDNSSDVTHLSPFQLRAIGLATANIYTDVVRQHQLILDDDFKDSVIKLLPSFGLCLSEPLAFVSNGPTEERAILKALESDNLTLLQGDLASDYDSIHSPCLKRLNIRINQLLDQRQQNVSTANLLASAPDSTAAASVVNTSGPIINPKLSPTEQLIQTLSYEKEQSLAIAQQLKETLQQQTQQLTDLKHYHDNTDRYAPLPRLEERDRAYQLLNSFFDQNQDADRFSSFEKQAMSLSAANHYAGLSQRHRLVLTEALKDQIISNHLPNYGFCFGDGLKFVIDNRLQQRQLINALREQDRDYMNKKLAVQIDRIAGPCAEQLDQYLARYF